MNVTGKNSRANNGLRVTIGLVEPSDDTPSVSLSLDSSLREGAEIGCTIQRTAREPQRCGRFSSPLRKLKSFYISPFNVVHSLSHALTGVPAPS